MSKIETAPMTGTSESVSLRAIAAEATAFDLGQQLVRALLACKQAEAYANAVTGKKGEIEGLRERVQELEAINSGMQGHVDGWKVRAEKAEAVREAEPGWNKSTPRTKQPGQILAPFSSEQVINLNAWQRRGSIHPFTCVNHADATHAGDGELVATTRGWICPFCAYVQDWAHEAMAVRHTPALADPIAFDSILPKHLPLVDKLQQPPIELHPASPKVVANLRGRSMGDPKDLNLPQTTSELAKWLRAIATQVDHIPPDTKLVMREQDVEVGFYYANSAFPQMPTGIHFQVEASTFEAGLKPAG